MSISNEQTEFMQCPNCGNKISIFQNYVTWCEKCEWNLIPIEKEKGNEKGFFYRLQTGFGKKQSQILKEIAKRQAFPKSKISFSGILSLLISMLIHLLTIGILFVGIWIIYKNIKSFNIIPLLFGLALVFLFWFLRPRMGKAEKIQVDRNEFTGTFEFFEKLGEFFNVKIDLIGINGDFNAAVSSVGWFQKKQVVIGLPYVSALSDDEILAVFCHEFAHLTTTDISQGIIVSTGLESLKRWYSVIEPQHLFEENTVAAILMLPFNLLAWLFSQLIKIIYYGLLFLTFHSYQLSEYRSDLIAANYSGKQAVMRLFKKMRYTNCFRVAVKNAALSKGKEFDLYKEISELIDKVPQQEIRRLEKVEAKEGIRFDVTHPPVIFREEVISTLPDLPAKIPLIGFDFGKMRRELAMFNKQIQEYLADNYSAYYH